MMTEQTGTEVERSESKAKSGVCYHCGENCPTLDIQLDDKQFCCEGCRTVYQILNDNGMCRYYDLDEQAGISLRGRRKEEYAYLDDTDVQSRLISFTDGERTRITFYLPQIHCASCIWLLENLYKLHPGIQESRVNFMKKELFLTFLESETSLRQMVETLASIGYAPAINLGNLDEDKRPLVAPTFFYQLGVAGFAFGNIMLLSFPEYLGLDSGTDGDFARLFGYLNILLALPVVFYSGRDYLRSAWLGIKHRELNIDVPITLGILTLFGRSVFEIFTHTGAGYLDSLAGLVFFLLIGKWFQQRTYHHISFDRDYRSYFPIAAHRLVGEEEQSTPLDKLQAGDRIRVKHQELIPADGLISQGEARLDYSFVTGESEPVHLKDGEQVFAGGRQVGQAIDLVLTKPVSQSYLTQLWNDEAFHKDGDTQASQLANRVGRYFTVAILTVAFSTLFYWMTRDISVAINAFTAVLIIACPCAVALAIPFIFGNALRIFGVHHFYLKNTQVIESIHQIDAVVFDKTGTLTDRQHSALDLLGDPLSQKEKAALQTLTHPSNHPISVAINRYVASKNDLLPIQKWSEKTGAGIRAMIDGREWRLGAPDYMTASLPEAWRTERATFLQIDKSIRAGFVIRYRPRKGLDRLFSFFRSLGQVYLLSGDNEREAQVFRRFFRESGDLRFRQSPAQKLAFIRELQDQGQEVMMVGDGLNDAGALRQSDLGMVVTDNTNNFTPASDAILRGDQFSRLPAFIGFARRSIRLVYGAYAFALVYNIIGLSYAVQGALSPIVAAILMPLSSISIVLFGVLSSNLIARKMGLTGSQNDGHIAIDKSHFTS